MLFWDSTQTRAAWWMLVVVSAIKVVVLLQDFRLVSNQHYMSLWITIVYLLGPAKRWVLPRLIVCFYIAAGLVKLNLDWLAGAGLYGRRPFGMPESFIPAACAYVVVLELIIVFGLLSNNRRVFAATIAQFVLFHLSSLWVVGFFSPLLMLLILSILPLSRYFHARNSVSPKPAFTSGRRVAAGFLCVFWLCQMVPRAYGGDPAITGEGRVFAPSVFDAPVQCRAWAIIHFGDESTRMSLGAPYLQEPLACDPVVFLAVSKALCRRDRQMAPLDDIDLLVESRRNPQEEFHRIVGLPSVCTTSQHYSMLHHNAWINRY
jgi:hypothetical protein